MNTKHWLRVIASKGQFSDEVAIRGADYNGEQFSFFAQDDFVQVVGDINSGSADAFLRVTRLDQKDDLVLIRLPGQTFGNGSTITVMERDLSERKEREPA